MTRVEYFRKRLGMLSSEDDEIALRAVFLVLNVDCQTIFAPSLIKLNTTKCYVLRWIHTCNVAAYRNTVS